MNRGKISHVLIPKAVREDIRVNAHVCELMNIIPAYLDYNYIDNKVVQVLVAGRRCSILSV